jgi:hypothetical protein
MHVQWQPWGRAPCCGSAAILCAADRCDAAASPSSSSSSRHNPRHFGCRGCASAASGASIREQRDARGMGDARALLGGAAVCTVCCDRLLGECALLSFARLLFVLRMCVSNASAMLAVTCCGAVALCRHARGGSRELGCLRSWHAAEAVTGGDGPEHEGVTLQQSCVTARTASPAGPTRHLVQVLTQHSPSTCARHRAGGSA